MTQQDLQVTNRLGIHARPAALITQTACGFVCDIRLTKDNITVDAKSIMGVMMLAAECGSSVRLTTDGTDEKEAAAALKKLFDDKFNEEF
ncbi:MAG: HPr family phosphocarrier protein [Elusimicrobiaceae bacterium]|nr:HPr family phosphocarrier protein [Elusimicrobiaceae bacterium]